MLPDLTTPEYQDNPVEKINLEKRVILALPDWYQWNLDKSDKDDSKSGAPNRAK